MHRIDGPGATIDNLWTDGDVGGGVEATMVTAKFQNALQEELANLVEYSGQALSDADDEQVLKAVLSLSSPWRSPVINGDFRFWQRTGTPDLAIADALPKAIGTTAAFVPDRWRVKAGSTGGAASLDRGVFTAGQGDVPGEPTHYLSWDQTTGSSGDRPLLEQPIENVRTFEGRTVTLSFYARVTSGTLDVRPTLRQDFGSGGSADVSIVGSEIELTTTWTRHTFTTALGSISGKTIGVNSYLALALEFEGGATFTAQVADIRLEPGSGATPFVRRPPTVELALCQRFYEQSTGPYVLVTAAIGSSGAARALHDKAADDDIVGLLQRFAVSKYPNQSVGVTWYGTLTGTAARVTYNGAEIAVTSSGGDFDSTGNPVITTPAGAAAGLVVALSRWAAEAEIPA